MLNGSIAIIYGTEIFWITICTYLVDRHYIGSTIPSLATRSDIVILLEGSDGSSETVK